MTRLFLCLLLIHSAPLLAQVKTNNYSDMILDPKLMSADKSTGFIAYQSTPWLLGILPVEFDSTFSTEDKRRFFNVCKLWSNVANVKCVEKTTELQYLKVIGSEDAEGRCTSEVGIPSSGIAHMTLPPNCRTNYITLHEIGHAFGLAHEHQRPDRDQYIIVDESLISTLPHAYAQFTDIDTSYPYDFHSVMHYGFTPRTSGSSTFFPRPEHESVLAQTPHVGSATEPSLGDRHSLQVIYGPPSPSNTHSSIGDINAILFSCAQGTTCDVILNWDAFAAPNAGVHIQNRDNDSEFKVCRQSPCTFSISSGQTDFSLKQNIDNNTSEVLDFETHNLFQQDVHANLIINNLQFSGNSNNPPVLTFNVHDSINYQWLTTNSLNQHPAIQSGINAIATYTVDQASCGIADLGPHELPNFTKENQFNGVYEDTIHECQAGRTYNILYQLVDSLGGIITNTNVIIKIEEHPRTNREESPNRPK